MDPNHAILFEPVQIGPKTLRNRFYQVPHCSGFGTEKPWTQAAHRGMKAEGGWAAVCTEYAPFAPDTDEAPLIAARFWDKDDLAALRLMTETAHANGALAGLELHHAGNHAENNVTRYPTLAPSQTASDLHAHVVAKAMEVSDIERVQRDWVEAAKRGRDAGFDIVYAYGAHSYLLMQFLSPFYNQRTDGYGGSLANRARFWLETLEKGKDAIGDDCAIATRIAVEGLGPSGIHVDEALEFVALADPYVDLWDVNVGSISLWSHDSGTSRYFEEGYQLEWTGRVREATSKPIVGVARLTNPDLMAKIIRSGAWDLIGSARPSIADPFLPQKIAEGRTDEIRECTGSNVCIMKVDGFGHLGCIQNPTAGEEHRRGWHPEHVEPAAAPQTPVLVVGAGPAGLECAVTLGRRGFEMVHLVEAEAELGGKLRWIRRLPTLGDWGRIVDHRMVLLDKLPNVTVIQGKRLTAKDVLDYGASVVVVATGSHWSGEGLQANTHGRIDGADPSLPHVLTPEQVAALGERPPGGRVIVYDAEGYFTAPGIAELLAKEDFGVTLVTSLEIVSPISDLTIEGPLLRQALHDAGVRMVTGVTITGVDAGRMSGDPNGLEVAGIARVLRIGDAVAPRMISEAVFEGHRAARELELPDPMAVRLFDRERRVPDRG
jgi:dimethylamine/trimethylamine dehydrogenase